MIEDLVGRTLSAQDLAVPTPGLQWRRDGKAAKAPGALDMEGDLDVPEADRAYLALEVDTDRWEVDTDRWDLGAADVAVTVQLQMSGEWKDGQVFKWSGPGPGVLPARTEGACG